MHSSVLFLASLLPLTLAAPVLEARAIAKPKILSLLPSGTGCPDSTSFERSISPDFFTGVIGYHSLASDDVNPPKTCTIALNYEVVIPSDGKADVELDVTTYGYFNAEPDRDTHTHGFITQTVNAPGKTGSSNKEFPRSVGGEFTLAKIKFTITGAAGSTSRGTISTEVKPYITGSNGQITADMQVDATSFAFLPLPQ